MAKKPTPEKAPLAAPVAATESDAGADELTPRERRYLLRVSRFLLNIADKQTFARALQHGYSADEHREGWRLYRVAMGENRTLDHHSSDSGSGKTIPNDVLQSLDAFENRWFPRTRTIIRRFAKGAAGAALEAAFFKDLAQQPLGPGVVGSVSTFVKRVDELKTSKLDGAKAVRDVLTQRGLTDATLDEIRKLLVRAETPDTAVTERKPAPRDARARLVEQREALNELRAWREDWRSTLGSVFDHNTLLALGLIAAKGRKKADDGEGEEEDEEPAA
jgi:hypothetical protein